MSSEQGKFKAITVTENAVGSLALIGGSFGGFIMSAHAKRPYNEAGEYIAGLKKQVDGLAELYAETQTARPAPPKDVVTYIGEAFAQKSYRLQSAVEQRPPQPGLLADLGMIFGLPVVGAVALTSATSKIRYRLHKQRQKKQDQVIIEQEINAFADALDKYDQRRFR